MGIARQLTVIIVVVTFAGCDGTVKFESDGETDAQLDGPGDGHVDVPHDNPGDGPPPDVSPDHPADIPETCGDGSPDVGEECDDGNDTPGDGCESDCTYTCHGDGECNDGDACTLDTCRLDVHWCTHAPMTCDDGDPCTEDYCEDGGCVNEETNRWYEDGDDDGYGNPDVSVCADDAPEGHVDNGEDCCDVFPVVHPGNPAWFVDPYICDDIGMPTYDYDCSGAIEQRYTDAGRCEVGSGACHAVPGWLITTGSGVPACGASGTWLEVCMTDTSGHCGPTAVSEQIQTCH